MNAAATPYSVPRKLDADLDRIRAYWEGLKRREAEMPFADDVDPSRLPDLSNRLMFIEVFDKPMRLRFGIVGEELKRRYGGDFTGKFLDDIEIRSPLQYLMSQASAAIEGRAPTFYRHGLRRRRGAVAKESYARLVLPMWGIGQVGMLLGAIAWR